MISLSILAYLRRGVAYKGKDEDTLAKGDLQRVLALDPGNKRAQVSHLYLPSSLDT